MFDTRYQRDHIGAQAKQINFKFGRGVADIKYHPLVLIRNISSVKKDGGKMVDTVS